MDKQDTDLIIEEFIKDFFQMFPNVIMYKKDATKNIKFWLRANLAKFGKPKRGGVEEESKIIKKGEVESQFLHEVGINPWAVDLLTESFNRVREATPNGVSFVRKGIRVTLEHEALTPKEEENNG